MRQVLLATIPADMVQSIELNKTLSANQDADGIGGSVNMVTKMAGEPPTFDAISTLGYSPIENGRYMGWRALHDCGKRFGANKRWGVIMGASYDYNGRGYNDIEPQPDLNPDGSATPYYDNIDSARISPSSACAGAATMGADYKLNDHSSLAAHFILSDFKDWGDKWTYTVQTHDKPKFKYSIRRPDFAIGSLSLGGNHIFNNKWFTWGSAVSRSPRTQRRRQSGRRLRRQQRVEELGVGQLQLRRRPQRRPLPSAVVARLHGAEHHHPG